MDFVLEEEKQALHDIEAKIEQHLKKHKVELRERFVEKTSEKCVDYDDIQNRATANKRYKITAGTMDEIVESRNCPYFARIDVAPLDPDDADFDIKTYYIGKKSLRCNSELLVIDWRADMADCYANQTETSFEVKGYQYNLHLRRALEIDNAQLLGYETLFERARHKKESALIVDPFLKKMLEKRRQEYQIADIIQTIQNNQNQIIREKGNANFIVQGCAGSGKTMILLHRLSYLKFQNPEFFQSGVTIITPNKAFKQYIRGLSDQLGLTTIEQKTIEEYYVELIHRFFPKLNVQSTVANENELPLEMRRILYSTQYAKQLLVQYHEYWESVLYQLEQLGIADIARKFNCRCPSELNHTKATYQELHWMVANTNRFIKEHRTAVKNKKIWVKKATKRLNKLPERIKVARDELSVLEKEGQIKKAKEVEKELNRLIGLQIKLPQALEVHEKELQVLLGQTPSEVEKQNAKEARVLVKKLSMEVIFEEVLLKNLLKLHEMHQLPYLQKNYRYKLYLKLMFCSTYYVTASRYDSFLNIDEAQDLSLCEYMLLKSIVGNRCTFNLYGDVNQLLYSYKGVTDWQVVSKVLSANVYTLNENYRNSNQITKYCNDQFNYQIQAIGNDLAEITECSLCEAIAWCQKIKLEKPKYRIAVIVKDDNKVFSKKLQNTIVQWDYSWWQVDLDKISIITVEQSKGVEFDAVVVLNHDMTPNERYVAYTRAISDLIVVSNCFADNEPRKQRAAVSSTVVDFDVLDNK